MRDELLWILMATVLFLIAVPAGAEHEQDISITENADGSATFTLTPEQWKACQAEGGCNVFTYAVVVEAVRQQAARVCGRSI